MGGVGAKPWRLPAVEAALAGQPATEASFQAASAHAADGAVPLGQNAFKVRLMPRTVFRALSGVAFGENQVMITGEAITRKDGRLKVTGAATYAAEFQVPGLVHAVLVQSTIAAGRIAGFDLQAAQGMPGVLAIITPGNAVRLRVQEPPPMSVIAPTAARPRRGPTTASTSRSWSPIRWSAPWPRPPACRCAASLARPPPAWSRCWARRMRPRTSAVAPARPTASAATRRLLSPPPRSASRRPTPRRSSTTNAMEPHATTARWQNGRLEVWTATQGVGATQGTLASVFGLTAEQVVVHSPYVGGGFGSKGNTWPPAMLAAMASRMVGRPVKLVLTRTQMYTSNGYRPQTIQVLKLGARLDGALVRCGTTGPRP